MSQINFETIRNEHPNLAEVLSRVQRWLSEKGNLQFIDARRMAYEIGGVTALELAELLELLRNEGYLVRKFKIKEPDGNLSKDTYSNYSDIPRETWDRFHQDLFEVTNDRIHPIFQFRN